jgi:hypothetical protein
MAAEGVLAPLSLHVQVFLNGKFYGLYELVENVEPGLLTRFGLPKGEWVMTHLAVKVNNVNDKHLIDTHSLPQGFVPSWQHSIGAWA